MKKRFGIILGIVFVVFIIVVGVTSFFKQLEKPEISEMMLEVFTKKYLIEIAHEEFGWAKTENNHYAEGHKILKAEKKDGKIYAYVVAEYGLYELKDGVVTVTNAAARPLTLIYEVKEGDVMEYVLTQYMKTEDGGDDVWLASLQKMFPEDLIDSAKVDYSDEFYQKQIRNYFGIN